MRKLRFFLTVALISILPSLGVLAQNQPTRQAASNSKLLVLRGGLLINGTGGVPLANSVITIANGKIQSVGTAGSVAVPADATVIDATGKTIIPGLVDSHVHLRNYQEQPFLYWGVTSIGDLGNPTGWLLAYRDAVEKGQAPGPYIMVAGAKFNAPLKPGAPLGPGDSRGFETFLSGNSARVYVWDEASVEKAVAKVKKEGVDGIKLYTRLDPAMMKLTTQVAHGQGLPVFAHYTSANIRAGNFLSTEDILDTGIDVHVHLFGLVKATAPKEIVDRIAKGENVQAWHLLDTSKFPALAQKMVEKKMFLNPTLAQFEGASKYRAEIDQINTAFVNGPIAAYPESVRKRYAADFKGGRREANGELEEGYKRAGLFVKEFVDLGGKVIAGTDTNGGNKTPGLTLHEEMRMLVEVGLTPMQAIQAATSWGMEAWRKNDAGTLEPGKRADILILNRNPLDDIRATTDIYRVIQGGSVVDREALAKAPDTVPRPAAIQENAPNPTLDIPLVDEIFPELISTNQKADVTIMGENFSKDDFVLLNDQIVRATPQGQDLRISVPSGLFKKSGTYPLVVVKPGSGGGVSNTYYLMVTSK